ncbi:hypothetical protein [Tianweitania sediminis]|uniref:Uncharacterized protein n=1 Tax=Tianweitania sediminis TaxID=1502156 RepID=A0A8J7R1S7_9HYPH|nr:hypothetical protein [Tianweitania sediminis]MBP0439847.1 hypothetical protein [Tianweitania sediminis]
MTISQVSALRLSRMAGASIVALSVAVLAGCGTAGMTDAMAVVAQPRLPAPGSATFTQNQSEQGAQQTGRQTNLAATAPRPSDQSPRNSDAFPNLNVRPQAAAAQLSAEDSKAMLADLRSTQGRINAANVRAARTMPDANALRRVGASHGDQALRQIAADSAAQ